jgi:Zinc dependent phospholipase C
MPAPRIIYLRAITLLIFLITSSPLGNSYSVLTHEEIVDLLWKQKIQTLLLKRFPDATEEDLRKAHAYAYGGCVLQDMGYYPFGNKYFSDLVHYVRSGDFVAALIRDSSDLNEYAFALGALAHYASDVSGHPIINRITAIEFPRLAKKYGKEVTYADDPKAHIRTEFGFDMVQVAKNRYTSDSYHDFIGFEVSRPLLERAFFETYYLKLEDVFGDVDLTIGSYRRGVGKFIPEVTRVALLSRHDQLVKENPNFSKKKFLYYLNRAGYEREWGTVYRKPGFGTRVLAFFLKIIPKVGPFRAVSFKIPTPQTEDMYIKSVDDTVENYSRLLQEVADNTLRFPNRDFDTGRETRAGEYVLTDKTYARLVHHLARQSPDPMWAALRQNVLEFYANLNDPIDTKKNKKDWEKLQKALNELKSQCPTCQQQGHPSADQ